MAESVRRHPTSTRAEPEEVIYIEDAEHESVEWLQSLMEGEDSIQPQTHKAKLPRVNRNMLQHAEAIEECFEPVVVSIGPYHHAKYKKLKPMEDLKKKVVRQFVKDCQGPAEELYKNIFKEIKQVRDFYEEDATHGLDDGALTRMMLMDGCFVLYYIYCLVYWKVKDLNMKSYYLNNVSRDLMLLENQLPFRVLEVLGQTFRSHEWKGIIENYINFCVMTPHTMRREEGNFLPEKPDHLLQILRVRFLGSSTGKKIESNGVVLPTFRGVSELVVAGIHFKPTPTNIFTDIDFIPHCFSGSLKLPSIAIDDSSTKSLFLNLIAYEMCPDVTGVEVQTFICVLQSLISHPDDVKVLREAGILCFTSGSDEVVMKMFKDLADYSVADVENYVNVLGKIGAFLENRGQAKVATWIAEVVRVYFKSPWTTIAVLAGFIALSASVLQTFFTIFPLRQMQ